MSLNFSKAMKLTEQEYEALIMTLAAGISGSVALKIKKQIKKFLPKTLP